MYLVYGDFGENAVHWYNTLLCLPVGVWYAAFKDKIDVLARKWYLWWPALAIMAVLFIELYSFRYFYHYYLLLSALFCIILTWVTMKVRFNNPILRWLGNHFFEIYIIQRIPITLIKHFGLNTNQFVYTALVVVGTLFCAWVFSLLLKVVDMLIFKKKKA